MKDGPDELAFLMEAAGSSCFGFISRYARARRVSEKGIFGVEAAVIRRLAIIRSNLFLDQESKKGKADND